LRVVVSDTSLIRALSHLDRLDLLAALLGEVIVPPAVAGELLRPRAPLPPLDVGTMAGVRVVSSEDQRAVNELIERDELDRGEAEAIAIALELKADLLLIDERRADARARAFGLETLGVLGPVGGGEATGSRGSRPPTARSARHTEQ
jgi:uncharacterized protein